MEVPRRPQTSSFTLPLLKQASPAALSPIGAAEKVTKKENLREKKDGAAETDLDFGEETFSPEEDSGVSVFVEAPDQTSELRNENTLTADSKVRLSSLDSFSGESTKSEERSAEESEEAKRKKEEEEAAAKERAAQRQLMAVEELVQSERNYLRLLQISTVTIRNNLQEIQVREG